MSPCVGPDSPDDLEITGTTVPLVACHGTFLFPADDPVYADHFPSAPVVPGSLIIHAFQQELARLGFAVAGIRNFRFRRFVAPGRYPFSLSGKVNVVRCVLLNGGNTEHGPTGMTLVSGEILLSCGGAGAGRKVDERENADADV